MSIHYVVKLYTDYESAGPDYLGRRYDSRGEACQFGVCDVSGAEHFLHKEEAFAALEQFMSDFGYGRIVSGSVFSVTEELVDRIPGK